MEEQQFHGGIYEAKAIDRNASHRRQTSGHADRRAEGVHSAEAVGGDESLLYGTSRKLPKNKELIHAQEEKEVRVRFYCIQYVDKLGCPEWLAVWFRSKRQALKYAKRHEDQIGTRYEIKGV